MVGVLSPIFRRNKQDWERPALRLFDVFTVLLEGQSCRRQVA